MFKLKIWRMHDGRPVEVFKGQIKEERFQFVQDEDTTYMVQLDISATPKIRGKAHNLEGDKASTRAARAKARCPHCGRSFVPGRGLTRHLWSCPKKPKPGRPKRQTQERAPRTQIQETPTKKETREQTP